MKIENLRLGAGIFSQQDWASLPLRTRRNFIPRRTTIRRFVPYRDGWPEWKASDEERALQEVWRVLRPGGHANPQPPHAFVLRTRLGSPHVRNPADRLQAYGQEDHCLLYSADFPARVEAHGLASRVALHHELLTNFDALHLGVNAKEPLMRFVKPEFE